MDTLQRFKTLKILLATYSNGMWFADFGMSLCGLIGAFRSDRIGKYKDQILYTQHVKGSILSKSRYETIKLARRMAVDYIFMVDSDQTFPKNTIARLVERGRDVVAANVAVKVIPSLPTARRAPRAGEPSFGVPVFTDPESTGLEEVWRIGPGVMLISRRAYMALPNSVFETRYIPEVDNYQGEDWPMCEVWEKAGIKMYIDHDLSKEVGHIGFFTYNHDVVGEIQTTSAEVVNG